MISDKVEEQQFQGYDAILLARIFNFLRPYKGMVSLALIGTLFSVLPQLLRPVVIQRVIDRYLVIDPQKFPTSLGLSLIERKESLLPFVYLFLGLSFIEFLASFTKSFMSNKLGQKVMADVRGQLIHHTLHQSVSFLTKTPIGTLLTRITSDVNTLNQFIIDVLPTLITDISLMLGIIVILFVLSPPLGLVTVATLPLLLLIAYFFQKMARKAYRQIRRSNSLLNTFIVESLSGIRVVRDFTQEKQVGDDFLKRNKALREANLAEVHLYAIFRPLITVSSSLATAVILFVGGYFALEGIVSVGVVMAFINLMTRFFNPILEIIDKFTVVQLTMASSERIFSLLEVDEEIPTHPEAISLDKFSDSLVFDNVSFRYNESDPYALKEVSFTLKKGETLAVVGYTGSGKSTLANLCNRSWDVVQGSLHIDGHDIREYSLDSIRKRIQPIQQTPLFFTTTIRENIDLNNRHTLEEIKEACRLVHADTFIERLPQGLETVLIDNGENLSAGERQLLSFARLVCSRPDIILLDEATANIDTEKEQLIQQSLKTLLENQTAIVIAHRLSTIRTADKILVLRKGEIVEEGDHKSLMAKQGLYHELYTLQNEKGIIVD